MLVREKIGKLGEEVREGFSRRTRKEFTDVVQGVSGQKRFLMRFQYGLENDLTLNQLTIVIVEKRTVEEEPKVTKIPDISEDKVTSEKGYYNGVYVIINFNK